MSPYRWRIMKDVSFVTKIPDHEIGQACVNELRRFGVDT